MPYVGKKATNVVDVSETQSLTVDGDLAVDTNTLKVDSTNNRVGVGTTSPETPIEIRTTNKLGGTFTGTTDGEGLRVTQTNYTSGNFISLVEAPFDDAQTAANVRIGAMFDGSGSKLVFGTSNSYGSGITNTAMFIDSSGQVGLNTTSPAAPLHVKTGTDENLRISSDSGVRMQAMNDAANAINTMKIGGNPLIFLGSGGAEAARIDSGLRLLIGTTSTGTTSGGAYFDPESLGRTVLFTGSDSTSSGVTLVAFNNPNGIVGGISTAASSTSFNTSSDYRLKENVTDITGAIDRVKTLAPKRFNFKVDPDNTVDGFLAHEAQIVVPEAVTGTKDQTEAIGVLKDADGNVTENKVVKPDTLQEGYTWTETETRPVYQGIDQAKLVPVLTAALQEAIAKIETLETKVAALEG